MLRGEDLLPSTPRQLALYAALTDIGVASGTPRFGHLPYVTGEGSKKLSKRDPQSNLDVYRERGFLPEGFANYLALLGWSIAEDRDIFSMAEMVEAFDVTRVSANPARFDLKKAEAINATHLRALPVEEFIERVVPVPGRRRPGRRAADRRAAARPRGDRPAGAGADDRAVRGRRPAAASCSSTTSRSSRPPPRSSCPAPSAAEVLDAATTALRELADWSTPAIEEALKTALVEGLGRKPRQAFGPVRVAVSGRTVSPPLYESIELLGRERTLARLAAPARVTERPPRRMTGPRRRARPPARRAGPYTGPAAQVPPRPAAAGGRSSPGRRRPAAAPGAVRARRRQPAWDPPPRWTRRRVRPRRRPGCAGRRRRAPRRTTSRSRSCWRCARGTGRWWRPLLGPAADRRRLRRRGGRRGRRAARRCVHRHRRRPRRCWTSPTPWVLLVTNLSLIVAIPVRVAGLGRRARHAHRLVVVGAGAAALAAARCRTRCSRWPRSGVGIGLSVLLGVRCSATRRSPGRCRRSAGCCVVVLLTTPLQSAAEEYLFRGYLSQAIAGWIRRPRGRRGRRRRRQRAALLRRARPAGPGRRSSTASPSGWPPPRWSG